MIQSVYLTTIDDFVDQNSLIINRSTAVCKTVENKSSNTKLNYCYNTVTQ